MESKKSLEEIPLSISTIQEEDISYFLWLDRDKEGNQQLLREKREDESDEHYRLVLAHRIAKGKTGTRNTSEIPGNPVEALRFLPCEAITDDFASVFNKTPEERKFLARVKEAAEAANSGQEYSGLILALEVYGRNIMNRKRT